MNEDQENNKKIIAEIDAVYKEYLNKMNELKDKQNELIDAYILKLEEKKKKALIKKLN